MEFKRETIWPPEFCFGRLLIIGKTRKKGRKEIFEAIMTENFLKLMLGTKPQIRALREHQEE